MTDASGRDQDRRSDHEPEPDVDLIADLELTPGAAEDVTAGAAAAQPGGNRGRYQLRLDEGRDLLG